MVSFFSGKWTKAQNSYSAPVGTFILTVYIEASIHPFFWDKLWYFAWYKPGQFSATVRTHNSSCWSRGHYSRSSYAQKALSPVRPNSEPKLKQNHHATGLAEPDPDPWNLTQACGTTPKLTEPLELDQQNQTSGTGLVEADQQNWISGTNLHGGTRARMWTSIPCWPSKLKMVFDALDDVDTTAFVGCSFTPLVVGFQLSTLAYFGLIEHNASFWAAFSLPMSWELVMLIKSQDFWMNYMGV